MINRIIIANFFARLVRKLNYNNETDIDLIKSAVISIK